VNDNKVECTEDLECESNICVDRKCVLRNVGEKCNQSYQCSTGNCMKLSEAQDYTC